MFLEIGVQLQEESTCRYEAIKRFKNSCNICCKKNLPFDCDKCPIATAHKRVLDIFEYCEELRKKKLSS